MNVSPEPGPLTVPPTPPSPVEPTRVSPVPPTVPVPPAPVVPAPSAPTAPAVCPGGVVAEPVPVAVPVRAPVPAAPLELIVPEPSLLIRREPVVPAALRPAACSAAICWAALGCPVTSAGVACGDGGAEP